MGTASGVKKLKNKRAWLEDQKYSGSYYAVEVDHYNNVSLTLSDCTRQINWTFGKPRSKRAMAKIKKVKAIIDEMHAFLTDPNAPKARDTDW